jgi:hypothetical protein
VARDAVSYEERTGWPAWVTLITVASLGAAGAGVLMDPSVNRATALLILALFALGVGGFWVLLGQLQVQVTRSAVQVGFGYVSLIRKRIPFADISAVEPVEYRPILEFGGWGIRFGRNGKRAWTIRGNRAVRLQLKDGKLVYVGSEKPERLAERIRAAAASGPERIGEAEPPLEPDAEQRRGDPA